jgi:hypothetical protein
LETRSGLDCGTLRPGFGELGGAAMAFSSMSMEAPNCPQRIVFQVVFNLVTKADWQSAAGWHPAPSLHFKASEVLP